MPELDLTALREKAEAAALPYTSGLAENRDALAAIGAHTRAFDPPTVLALLDRVEFAESEHKALRDEFWGIVAARNKALNRAEKAERELTELRAGRGKWKGADDE